MFFSKILEAFFTEHLWETAVENYMASVKDCEIWFAIYAIPPCSFSSPVSKGNVDIFRISCPEVFYKKALLNNFANFIGKHLCLVSRSLVFDNKHRRRCFPVNFAKFLIQPIFKEHLRWVLLCWKVSVKEFFTDIRYANRFILLARELARIEKSRNMNHQI